MWRLETGLDAAFHPVADGVMIGGIVANYAQSSADVSSVFGAGEIETTAWGVGATLTWHGENGFYLDLQGRANWFDSELASDTAGWEIDNDGDGRSLSAEFGRRADIGGGFAITPQMQYVHSNVDFDTFEDPFGAVVEHDRGKSFRGRFGLALDHSSAWTGASGAEHDVRGYAIANLHYEFLDEMRVSVTGTGFSTGEEPLWGSLGLGGEYSRNKRISLFGEASAETTLNGFGDSQRLTARVGLRAAF
jgi:fibronectin-binding autotransporter adhesin